MAVTLVLVCAFKGFHVMAVTLVLGCAVKGFYVMAVSCLKIQSLVGYERDGVLPAGKVMPPLIIMAGEKPRNCV